MDTIDEHELQAWIDGELAPSDAARVEAAVAADPVLSARAARERRLRERLRAGFDPVLDEPVPARLAELLKGGAAGTGGVDANAGDKVVPLARRTPVPRRHWGMPAYALAASLAVLAASLWLRPEAGPVRMDDGVLVASGSLERGLDEALASAPDPGADVAIGLSFRDADGRICRSFVHRSQAGLAGLACRDDGQWSLPVLARPVDGGGELRQASSSVPPEVQAAIDARLQDEVFDAEAERQAREAGWR